MPNKNQLVKMDQTGYDVSNMIFVDPKNITTKSGFSYETIAIKTRNPDGSEGDLVIRTVPNLFSKGLEKGKDFTDSNKFKWQVPISFQDRDSVTGCTNPTPEQAAWMDNFNAMIDRCLDWIMENLDKLGLGDDYQRPLSRKFSPMFYAKVKDPVTGKPTTKVAPGAGPWLYTKTMYKELADGTFNFQTQFFDKQNNELDPMDIVGVHCTTTAALKFESIYKSGDKMHLQIKLFEMVLEEHGNRRERLLGVEEDSVRLDTKAKLSISNETASNDFDNESVENGSVGEPEDPDADDPVVRPESPPKIKSVKMKEAVKIKAPKKKLIVAKA